MGLVAGTVLVVEYGAVEVAGKPVEPPGVEAAPAASSVDYQSLPIAALNNRTATLRLGRTVGGASAVNGMFFDRGSRRDYDGWRQAGSPEFDGAPERWDWDGLLPFFRKVGRQADRRAGVLTMVATCGPLVA